MYTELIHSDQQKMSGCESVTGMKEKIGEAFSINITREEARRFILSRQGLLGKHRFIGKDGAYQYVRQAGCIQYDPVDVCGKNAELTLLARVKGFKKKNLSDLLYQDRILVDYSDKELSIWPREDWPYFSGYRKRSIEHGRGFQGIPELEERAVSYIRENGPVSSDTLPIEGTSFFSQKTHARMRKHSYDGGSCAVSVPLVFCGTGGRMPGLALT